MYLYYACRVVDDHELFEEQKFFDTEDLIELSGFLNRLLFHAAWEERFFPVLLHCHSLLRELYNRDDKQHFCSENHWQIKLVDN